MTAKEFQIVNGPSKWDLILALFDTTEDREPSRIRQDGRIVNLEIVDSKGEKWEGRVVITGVEKEKCWFYQDSDWKLKGGYYFPPKSPLGKKWVNWYPFIAHFNTDTRKGWMKPVKRS